MVGDPRDSQPTYRRNKHEMWGANGRAGRMAADGSLDQVVNLGGVAGKYVNSIVVAVRGSY